MAKAQNATQVLIAAKWMIEHIGWCRRAAHTHTIRDGKDVYTAFCPIGAINMVQVSKASTQAQMKALGHLRYAIGTAIAYWNDLPGRTQQGVLFAFDKAIRRSRQQQSKRKR